MLGSSLEAHGHRRHSRVFLGSNLFGEMKKKITNISGQVSLRDDINYHYHPKGSFAYFK